MSPSGFDQGNLLLHFARNGAFGPGGSELLVLDRGEGPYVFDTEGRRYLDGLSSLFCSQLGYSYGEEMAAVAAAQLTRLGFNTNWGTAHPPAIELAEKLASLAPGGIEHVFFACGGSEAVETAWKLVRQYHVANGEAWRTKAIARTTAYHGVTLGALSFTGVPGFKKPFGPAPVPTRHVSNTNAFRRAEQGEALTRALLDELEAAIRDEGPDTIAMVIAEPVQNAGGCLQPPAGYWAGLREICDRHGILLVADEVITGFGRVGEGVLENVRANEADLAAGMESLRSLPIVGDVRGSGYFWAVELVPDGAEGRFDAEQREELLRCFLPGALLRHGLIARGDDHGDTVVQVAPPLICGPDALDELVDRLRAVLEAVSDHTGIARTAIAGVA
jgi:adenosylmethionine-8-amino-7-oxononanoate aminotransferase